MKYKMITNIEAKHLPSHYNFERLYHDDPNLKQVLRTYLKLAMAGSEDPDLRDKEPDGYITNLMMNKLGDFSKSIMIVSKAKEVNGIIVAVPQESYYNITTLGVYKEYRGKKIGVELLNKMIHQLSILGEAYVTLDVHSLNYSALNLYNKYGFRIKV